tara:strand:+ start:1984 stop:2889 length:906 start_codon:yes stop_codon:yes gene_type:complete
MKIAILLSGQARNLEQSAAWWNKVFPKDSKSRIEVDFFCHFWEEPDRNLYAEVSRLFNPVKCFIQPYDDVFIKHVENIRAGNLEWPGYHELVPPEVASSLLFSGTQISDYGYNFHAMFLSAAAIGKMCGDLSDYDFVVKTRSDAVFNPMAETNWMNLFHNMRKDVYNNIIFAPWMRLHNGSGFFGDLAFISSPKTMHRYLSKLDENLVTICTKDKYLFGERLLESSAPIAHWMWTRLSLTPKVDWLATSVVWPTPFDIALIRDNDPVTDLSFADMLQRYKAEEQKRHDAIHQRDLTAVRST